MIVTQIIEDINLLDKNQIEVIYTYVNEITSKGKIFESDDLSDTIENRVANYKDDLCDSVNVHTSD